jgi:hypothetical protein
MDFLDIFPAQTYKHLIARATRIRNSEDHVSYETDLVEIKLGENLFYFIKNPADEKYYFLCIHHKEKACQDLVLGEAIHLVVTDRKPIQDFIEGMSNSNREIVTRTLDHLVDRIEKAKLKGKSF